MCGRFTITASTSELAELLGVSGLPDVRPRYNAAPTQMILAARLKTDGQREAALFKWGLVPSWATDPTIGYKMINARGETVATKPSFRQAFKKQRCLIVADGFYEWKKDGKVKRPFRFRRPDGKPFAFAGIERDA
jgi:putative SOS response-associated peptidase YedK